MPTTKRTRYLTHPLDYEAMDLGAIPSQVLEVLEHEIHRAHRHWASDDAGVYVGIAGFVIMNLRVSALDGIHSPIREAALDDRFLLSALSRSPPRLPRAGSKTSFLETSVGLVTVALIRQFSVRYHHELFDNQACENCLSILCTSVRLALESQRLPEDGCEVLYGRAGLLYALLLLRSQFDTDLMITDPSARRRGHGVLPQLQDLVSDNTLLLLVNDIVQRGTVGAKAFSRNLGAPGPSLMWSWHGKLYLGAAHGVAGILQMLVSCPSTVISPFLPVILGTTEWLVNMQAPNGNWPIKAEPTTASGGHEESLVQWCHGAPGIVIFLATLLGRVQKLDIPLPLQERINDCILRSTKLIYERGLLFKGVGLCHGIAGSVFALLKASDVLDSDSERPSLFLQAVHLAVLATRWRKMTERGEMRVPDRPYSLYEGLAGMCVAWAAIMERLGPGGQWKRGSLGMPGFDDLGEST